MPLPQTQFSCGFLQIKVTTIRQFWVMLISRKRYFRSMSRVSAKTRQRGHAGKMAGFSLVELLVVVMVVLVIAAIAIPNLVHARMKANEAAAVASMKTIDTAQVMYATQFPDQGYSPSLVQLGANGSDCTAPTKDSGCIIMDEVLISGVKSGYVFTLQGDAKLPSISYTLSAQPASPGFSGRCGFAGNETGAIVRVSPTDSVPGRLAMGSSGSCD